MKTLKTLKLLSATAALAGGLFLCSEAQAGPLDACGDIEISADAECEVVVEGGCEAMCTPLSVEAACAAELKVGCDGECNFDLDVECTNTCFDACQTECEIDPPSFDCAASCRVDCGGSCDAKCAAGPDGSECRASCEATCGAECDASCNVQPGQADCMTNCNECCGGTCTAEANLDCQISCQAEAYADCKVDIQGGCEAQCQKPEGALFCDGKYVDTGNNLEECVAALVALFDIDVEGYAEGSCENGMCSGVAGGSISCSVEPERDQAGWMLGLLMGIGLLGLRRKR